MQTFKLVCVINTLHVAGYISAVFHYSQTEVDTYSQAYLSDPSVSRLPSLSNLFIIIIMTISTRYVPLNESDKSCLVTVFWLIYSVIQLASNFIHYEFYSVIHCQLPVLPTTVSHFYSYNYADYLSQKLTKKCNLIIVYI